MTTARAPQRLGGRFLAPVKLLVVVVYLLLVLQAARALTPDTQTVLLTIVVFVILAISLDLAAGIVGLYSLGHAALFAVGAYLTAIIAQHMGLNVLLLLPVAVVGTALVGGVVGILSLRVSGLYFAITTFVLSLLTTTVINRLPITGSYAGLIGPNFPSFPAGLLWLGNSLVWCGGLCAAATVFIARSVRSSPSYPVLLAVRDAEPLARSAGINPGLARVSVFVLSSALAGLAGWLFAFLGVLSPGQFDWTVSVNILVMVILGGINTTWGPALGAIFINAFNSYVSISPLWRQTIFGALFVLTIVLMPTGLAGLVRLGFQRLGPSRRSARAAAGRGGEPEPDSRVVPTTGIVDIVDRQPPRIPPETYAVHCAGVSYRFTKGVYAVRDLDFTVRPGTIHGLIGPNGSGKSTLLNIISGHLRPEAGTVRIAGTLVQHRPANARAGVGLRRTFQAATLVHELPTAKNPVVGVYTRVGGLGVRTPVWHALPGHRRLDRQISSDSQVALRRVGIPSRWDAVAVSDTPHGIQQLLQLAVAAVAEPTILMLDEPVAGLTASEVEETAAVLRELRAAGVTIVVVEHHTSFLFDICDEITVLNAGTLVTSGSPTEVRAHNAVREVYLGQ